MESTSSAQRVRPQSRGNKTCRSGSMSINRPKSWYSINSSTLLVHSSYQVVGRLLQISKTSVDVCATLGVYSFFYCTLPFEGTGGLRLSFPFIETITNMAVC